MTQTSKQWATTGFIIGVASGITAAVIIFFLLATPSAPAAVSSNPAPKATTISGTIELDPSVAAKVATPAVVFVIARAEGRKDHPVLAKRLDVKSFPARFSLGPEDAMMGQNPPPRVSLEARVDRDGDAATREPGAPSASIGTVAMGSTNITLRLR